MLGQGRSGESLAPTTGTPSIVTFALPPRSVFPISPFGSVDRSGEVPPPTDEPGLGETDDLQSVHRAHDSIDEHGRRIHQREWTRQYIPIKEYDGDGDAIPDGDFSDHDNDYEMDLFKDLEILEANSSDYDDDEPNKTTAQSSASRFVDEVPDLSSENCLDRNLRFANVDK